MKATSTGRNNEVVILGVGAIGLCKGVKGTLKSGDQVLVQVDNIDPEKGLLDVSLVQ
jgi:translation initiation factor 2 alpha subunit (eIF-2alpha)